MKIAVISDIHANKDALNRVLEDIEIYNPDMIFCLGDLILAGYDPNYVCQKILELKEKYKDNFLIIQGNTDKMVACATDEMIKKTKEAFPCMGYSLEDDIKITDKKYIDFVRDLKENTLITINNIKIQLVHGSPRNQSENIYPDMPVEDVEEIIKDSPADIILCGHTHKPCGYSLNSGKTVINAGSLGRSMTQDKNAVYLQLNIDKNSAFYVEHRIIKYDNNLVSQKILSRGFKYCDDLARMYI